MTLMISALPKYAHQEKRAKRDEKLAELRAKAENEKMAKLYRQEILGEVAQQTETATPGKQKKAQPDRTRTRIDISDFTSLPYALARSYSLEVSKRPARTLVPTGLFSVGSL